MGSRGPTPKAPGRHAPGTQRDKKARSGPKSPPSTASDLYPPPVSARFGAVAVEHWHWLCARLREMRLDARANRADMVRWCRLQERLAYAEEQIGDGSTAVVEESTRYGSKEVKSKWVEIASDLHSHVTRLSDRFGLTPSARGSLGGVSSPATSESEAKAAKYIKGRKTG